MIRRSLCIFALALGWMALTALPAPAEGTRLDGTFLEVTPELQEAWGRHFEGRPQIPISVEELPILLKPTEGPDCAAEASELLGVLKSYELQALDSQYFPTLLTQRKLDKLLRGYFPFKGSQPRCAKSVFDAYALASLWLLEPENYDPVHRYSERPRKLKLLMLAATLINQGKVKILPSELREIYGGAYECADSTIYLDPIQKPFDLALGFAHELDHWLRDKKYPLSSVQRDFHKEDGSIDWKSYVMMDELVAIGQSVQRLKVLNGEPGRKPDRWGFFYINITPELRNYDRYAVPHDLSMLTRSGPMEKLWKKGRPNPAREWDRDTTSYYYYPNRWLEPECFLANTFLRSMDAAWPYEYKPVPWSVIEPEMKELAAIAARAYFPGQGFELDITSVTSHLGRDFAPILDWTDSRNEISYFQLGSSSRGSESRLHGEIGNNLIKLLESLDPVDSLTASPSETCTRYLEASERPESPLAGYVGNLNPLDERPTEKGVKPTEKGVKPTEKGVKPALRPCIKMRGQL